MTDVNVDKVLKAFVVIIVFAEPKLSDSYTFLLAKSGTRGPHCQSVVAKN